MQEARIKLLQRMPIFGGIQSESLEYLLGFCPVVDVPKDNFFFREGEEGDALFVLEIGQAAVRSPGAVRIISSRPSTWATVSAKWPLWTTVNAVQRSVRQKTAQQSVFHLPISTDCTGRM